jgi:4-hydroxybenzoate polyprenyltransferase
MTVLERWRALPAWVRWTLGLLLIVVVYALAYGVVEAVAPEEWDDLDVRLALVVLVTPLVLVQIVVERRRLGGKGQLGLFQRAMRTGRVPHGADRPRWLPVARKRERFFREGRVVLRVFWCVMVVLLVVLAVACAFWDATLAAVLVVVTVAYAAFGWWMDRLWGKRARSFASVVVELEADREGRDVAAGADG